MKYIDNLIANCEQAKNATPKNCFVLDSMDDLKGIESAIYIIEEIGGDDADTHLAFAEYKNTKARKCSRLNKKPSSILYVGSSTTGVKKRINEHLGNGYEGTYALHLNHWFPPRKMKITIQVYALKPEVLQIVEDAISYDLSTAFGKLGGNNK